VLLVEYNEEELVIDGLNDSDADFDGLLDKYLFVSELHGLDEGLEDSEGDEVPELLLYGVFDPERLFIGELDCDLIDVIEGVCAGVGVKADE